MTATYPTLVPTLRLPRLPRLTRPNRPAPCETCDDAARSGVLPGTVVEVIVSGDGKREVHRAPDPRLNDAFYPGSRSFRAN